MLQIFYSVLLYAWHLILLKHGLYSIRTKSWYWRSFWQINCVLSYWTLSKLMLKTLFNWILYSFNPLFSIKLTRNLKAWCIRQCKYIIDVFILVKYNKDFWSNSKSYNFWSNLCFFVHNISFNSVILDWYYMGAIAHIFLQFIYLRLIARKCKNQKITIDKLCFWNAIVTNFS